MSRQRSSRGSATQANARLKELHDSSLVDNDDDSDNNSKDDASSVLSDDSRDETYAAGGMAAEGDESGDESGGKSGEESDDESDYFSDDESDDESVLWDVSDQQLSEWQASIDQLETGLDLTKQQHVAMIRELCGTQHVIKAFLTHGVEAIVDAIVPKTGLGAEEVRECVTQAVYVCEKLPALDGVRDLFAAARLKKGGRLDEALEAVRSVVFPLVAASHVATKWKEFERTGPPDLNKLAMVLTQVLSDRHAGVCLAKSVSTATPKDGAISDLDAVVRDLAALSCEELAGVLLRKVVQCPISFRSVRSSPTDADGDTDALRRARRARRALRASWDDSRKPRNTRANATKLGMASVEVCLVTHAPVRKDDEHHQSVRYRCEGLPPDSAAEVFGANNCIDVNVVGRRLVSVLDPSPEDIAKSAMATLRNDDGESPKTATTFAMYKDQPYEVAVALQGRDLARVGRERSGQRKPCPRIAFGTGDGDMDGYVFPMVVRVDEETTDKELASLLFPPGLKASYRVGFCCKIVVFLGQSATERLAPVTLSLRDAHKRWHDHNSDRRASAKVADAKRSYLRAGGTGSMALRESRLPLEKMAELFELCQKVRQRDLDKYHRAVSDRLRRQNRCRDAWALKIPTDAYPAHHPMSTARASEREEAVKARSEIVARGKAWMEEKKKLKRDTSVHPDSEGAKRAKQSYEGCAGSSSTASS